MGINRRPVTAEKAQIRAEELCARAERSSGEIRLKLRQWGVSDTDAAAIIATLIDRRFIDDERFSRAYVRDKLEFGKWGRKKIALGLYQKGVSKAIIAGALDQIDQERYESILRQILAVKRRSLSDPDGYESRQKLFRFALSRGFESSLISKVMQSQQG